MAAEQVKLFTQADLASLNAQLDIILKNLNTHVNMSLSKAHSVKVVAMEYYDSAGDLVNKPFDPITDTYVLEFQFGEPPNNTHIYVPARIVTSVTAHVTDPGPRSTTNGITFQATSPAGTSTSPGVPLAQKSLVTTSPGQIALDQAVTYNDLLLMHQLCSISDDRELQCHGGISYSTETILDTLGHTFGRRVVNIGWGGVLYKLPGDRRVTGPPQGVRGLRAVTNDLTNPYCNRQHHAKDDDGTCSARLMSWFPATPIPTIEWQVNNSNGISATIGNTWTTLNPGGGPASGTVPAGFGISGSLFTIVESPNYQLTITFFNGDDSTGWKHFVRAKATTPTLAESTSNVCAFTGNDEDGSWGITWYGVPEYHEPSESKWSRWESWLTGASTLYH